MKKVIIGIVIGVAISLIVGFAPIVEVSYAEPLDYQEQSRVAREDFAWLRQSSPGFEADPGQIGDWLNLAYPPGVAQIQPIGYVTITNADTIEGTFKVRITFYSGDDEYTECFQLQLRPGQREEVKLQATQIHYDKDDWYWEHEITPDTRTAYKRVSVLEYLGSRF